jgi:hypothetical protein
MSVNSTRLQEGDALTAASLNDKLDEFSNATKGVNAITTDDIARKSLGPYHTEGLVDVGYLSGWSHTPPRIEVATSTMADLTSAVHPNWTVLTDGSTPAQITWTSAVGVPGGAPSNIRGFLALANVEMRHVYEDALAPSAPTVEPPSFGLRFAVRQGVSGTWVGVDRTERFRSNAYNENTTTSRDSAYHPSYFDIPLKSFLFADDASPMSGIRVEMCFNTPWTGAPTNTPYAHFLRYNLSVIPLFGAL